MLTNIRNLLIYGMSLIAPFCKAQAPIPPSQPLETVAHVDLSRYLGSWFEIAKFPNRFQKGCHAATAEYTLQKNGTIEVTNRCLKDTNGTETVAHGRARVADLQSNAKLKVSFLPTWLRWTGIGEGDYWIIQLDTEYQWAVVSEPRREFLWILARKPELTNEQNTLIKNTLHDQGFDLSRLEKSR